MRKVFLVQFFMVFCIIVNAQVPQGFNYQAIARDVSGNPIAGATIQVMIGILSDTSAQTVVWEELHNPVKTNAFGLFSLVIGTGERQSGSALFFNDINWNVTPLYLKTQINQTGTFKYMGSAQLWSVPYSMIAGDLEGSVKKLSVVGDNTLSDEALFEVKRKDGETIFAVYNHGVRVYMPLDTLSKARRGGFAIGGFDRAKGTVQDYFVVNPDSIRAYIDTNTGKAKRGGFAIGGFDRAKAGNEEYLRVTRDSTRVYVNQLPKGTRGGFAIGGFSGKTTIDNFLNLTKENYFIGHKSGSSNVAGLYNAFIGYEAGLGNISGFSNIFLGYKSGSMNTEGGNNLFIGNSSGYNNKKGEDNIFLGTYSGYSNTGGIQTWMGSNNIFIGSNSGNANTVGGSNIFIGTEAGSKNIDGTNNIYIGDRSGSVSTGFRNIFLGALTGMYNNDGTDNIFIGNQSGQNSTTGVGNVFLGGVAGDKNNNGNENTYLGNNSGAYVVSGNQNVFVGWGSGTTSTGDRNTFIGYSSGGPNSNSGNIFIGYQAGKGETAGNRLYIENSPADKNNALIYGDFDNDIINLNGTVNIRDVLKLTPRETAPFPAAEGDIYFDSITKKLMVYDGTSWQACW